MRRKRLRECIKVCKLILEASNDQKEDSNKLNILKVLKKYARVRQWAKDADKAHKVVQKSPGFQWYRKLLEANKKLVEAKELSIVRTTKP